MTDIAATLDAVMDDVRANFAAKNAAREAALPLCRECIRYSANAIRAVHRNDFETAAKLVENAGAQVRTARERLSQYPDILYAGFVHDAQKEFAEASITLALISHQDLPAPRALDVELPAYLNGMGEAVGELRRHLLDGSLNTSTTLSSPATSSPIPHGPVSPASKTSFRLENALCVVHTQNVFAITLAATNPATTATMFTSAIPAAINRLFVG